jgi:hypothetical protein
MPAHRTPLLRYQKSESGQQAFKQRSPDFSAKQRSAYLLFDGKRGIDEVLSATAGLGITSADIDDLVAKGFLELPEGSTPTPAPSPSGSSGSAPAEPPAGMDRYKAAYPIATRLTSQLGLRGFKLNLAVEAAAGLDDLIALLPKITDAVGPQAVQELKQALGVR